MASKTRNSKQQLICKKRSWSTVFTLWTSSLLSISSIEEVILAKPRLPHWRSGPSFRFYIKATSMTLYHQQLSQSSLKESVFFSTNLVRVQSAVWRMGAELPHTSKSPLSTDLFSSPSSTDRGQGTLHQQGKNQIRIVINFFKFFFKCLYSRHKVALYSMPTVIKGRQAGALVLIQLS